MVAVPGLALTRQLLARTWHNALAVMLTQISTFVTLLAFGRFYADAHAGVVIGLVTTILGAVSILSVGGAIVALRTASIQRSVDTDDSAGWERVLREEFATSWIVGLLSIVFTCAVVVPTAWLAQIDARLVVAYLAGNLLWFLVTPASLVANGVLQALDLDGRNLRAAVGALIGQLVILAVVLWWRPDVITALAVTAVGDGVVAAGILHVRLRGLARVTGQNHLRFAAPGRVSGLARLLGDRAQAGADGLVYMVTFFVATTVAARYSPSAGADIAAAVAVMRLIIIPVKQLGLVGGRMSLSTPDELSLLTVAKATIAPCAIAAAALLAWATSTLGTLPLTLCLLLALQLLLEPFAGVLFAAVKVAQGPARGTWLLIGLYVLAVIPILAALGVAGLGAPVLIWAVLLTARALFAAGSLRLALTPPP